MLKLSDAVAELPTKDHANIPLHLVLKGKLGAGKQNTPPHCGRRQKQNRAYLSMRKKQGTNSGLKRWSKKGRNKMQTLPPELKLPAGDRFTLPTVSAVRELIPTGGQLPAHMVLMMICGKELWVPLDREIARQMANILAPFRE